MNTGKDIIGGCMTAIITPFKNDLIDYEAVDKIIDSHIKSNVGILVCGTTGETPTLTETEYKQIIEYVVKKVDKRLPVMAGCGSNSTRVSIEKAQFCQSVGVDILLAVTPYYNKTTQEGIYQHYKAIAESVDIPLMMYNVPARTGLDMSVDTVVRLSKIKNILGVKEASGDVVKAQGIVANTHDDFLLYSGNDEINVPLMSIGSRGIISVVANAYPQYMRDMVDEFKSGNSKKAGKMQLDMLKLINLLFCETNPIPIKKACFIKGICENEVRLPLVPMSDENSQKLIQEMKIFENLA